jgi:hypothetical protein
MNFQDLGVVEWVLIVDGTFMFLFSLWLMRPRKKIDYGRSTRASLRNGRPAKLWRG